MHASLETGWIYSLLGIAAFLLIAGGAYIFLFRGSRSQPLKASPQFPGYGSRLGLIEDCPLGYDQKLVLVRRDHVEHLLFVSPETIFLIEAAISPPSDGAQDALAKRWSQSEVPPSRPQRDLFTPPSSLSTPASVFAFPEHPHTPSQLKEPQDFSMPSPQKDQNHRTAPQDLRNLHLNQPASGQERNTGDTPFIPLKHPSESGLSTSPPWEAAHQGPFSPEPLEKELEKLHGKVERLTSELTLFSQPQEAAPLEASEELSSSHIVSPFGSIPPHKSASPVPYHQTRSNTYMVPESPPLSDFSEEESRNHEHKPTFDAASRTSEIPSLAPPVFPEQTTRQKSFLEQTSPELPSQSKSGVSLQEIEKEFARLLGNRPPS